MSMSFEIRIERLAGSRLLDDYYEQADALAPFFAGSPWDPDAYRRKAAEVDRRFDAAAREDAAAAIRATSAEARDRLDRIRDGDGLVVTTGQQAGLFTGPLYTVYKTLTAVRLARTLEKVLDRPVAPLFWIASDDHDWAEVNHAHLLDRRNRLRRIETEGEPGEPPRSMARRRLGPGVEAAVAELARVLPDTEFSRELLETVARAYRPERSVADAFGELIATLFQRFDLLLVDPSHPAVKRRAATVIERELAHAEEHGERLAEQTRRLEDAGYARQAPVLAGATNVFYEDERGRERVLRTADGWRLRRTRRILGESELRGRLEEEPERFSPNVFLRPVVEAAVFPTVGYVAGPGELGYYAQIGCLYEAHGIGMPLIFPRAGVTLIEEKIRKVLDKFDLEPDDLRPPLHEVAARVLREQLPADVRGALATWRARLDEAADGLVDAATSIDPTLRGPIHGVRNAAHIELNELERKIVRRVEAQDDIALRQLEKARVNLYPNSKRQERVLNVLQYLTRYGGARLDDIAESIEAEIRSVAPVWAGVQCE